MNPKILLVDDSRLARLKIEEVLRRCGVCSSFVHAEDGARAVALLAEQPCDLVLCDVLMPGSDGFDFLRRKRAESGFEDIPVIMLTAREDMEIKLQCLEAGAADYLLKPFHDQELVARAKVHLQLKELRDSLKRKNRELERLIRIDALTGVANRLHLGEALRREFSRGRRHALRFGLAILDVDRFKTINDRYGHQVGDQVLQEIARRLRSGARAHDLLGRYGGEEFALLALQAGSEETGIMAERCRRLVSAKPLAAGGQKLHVTLSAGVSSYPEGGAESEDELLRQADEALYEAKRTGRDRLVVWQPGAGA